MKKFSFLALAAVGMLFAACSSEKDEVESQKLNQYDLMEGQSAWLSVGIAMPGDAITRAGNEDLIDGESNEYAVYSGKLVLFKGASEDAATLVNSYDLNTSFNTETGDAVPLDNDLGQNANGFGEITSTSQKVVQEIEAPSLGANDNLYAYVILNNGTNNVSGIEYATGTTFADFKVKVLKGIGIDNEAQGFGNIATTGLVMTNVPVASQAGGPLDPTGAKITTLSKIDQNAIYSTKEEALNGNYAACIYVERAAVKVEVRTKAGFSNQIELGSGNNLDISLIGWSLGNVNNGGTTGSGYYNTRQFDASWLPYANNQTAYPYLLHRMVGRDNFFSSGHDTGYRTYFGRDVNYSGREGLITPKVTDYSLAPGAVTYTYENTFDENSQIYANTTFVGFKVSVAFNPTATGDNTFYTIEGQPNTPYSLTDLSNAVAQEESANINSAINNINAIIDEELSKTTAAGRELSTSITKVTFKVNPVVALGTRNETTGEMPYTYTLSLSDLKDQTNTALSASDIARINTLVAGVLSEEHKNNLPKVYQYKDGEVYYAMRISHFGDVETPWSAPSAAYNDYSKVYPTTGKSIHATPIDYGSTRAAAWLGRWGIVRNNWYRLEVEEIKGIGSPVPVDFSGTGEGSPGSTPDDNPTPEKYFIQAHVHILPWVLRTQSVKF